MVILLLLNQVNEDINPPEHGETVKNAYGLFVSGYYGKRMGKFGVGGGPMVAIGNWYEPLAFLITAHGIYSPDSGTGFSLDFSTRIPVLGQREFSNTNGTFAYLSFGLGIMGLPGIVGDQFNFYKLRPDVMVGTGFEWAITPELSILGQVRYDILGVRDWIKENVVVGHLGLLIYGR
ncbi:MAG: hypothetical protein GXO29_02190 [Thermotogae bacterium]|nr:hypothetical protein [Thermotogota bacterium]